MDPPDDNFSFDFFDDEPPAGERAQGIRGRLPQRARRGAAPPAPPRQAAPLLRLLALVFFVIFLLLVFALLVNSCAGQSRGAAYKSYMEQVSTIAQQSSADGLHAVSALTTPGLTVKRMVSTLGGIAASEQQNLQSAQSLSAPGRLRAENGDLVESLQLRVLGLQGLAGVFGQDAASKATPSEEALALSQQAYRLLASDIVWDDLFLKPATTQLSDDGVGGVNVPESHFLANPNLIVTPGEMALVVTRIIAGAPAKGTCTGLHGTDIVSVEALPNGGWGARDPSQRAVGPAQHRHDELEPRVPRDDPRRRELPGGADPGAAHHRPAAGLGRPDHQDRAKVQLIDPNEDASVMFGDLGDVPFAAQTTVNVDVAAVCGETNLSNNHAQFNVIFSAPGLSGRCTSPGTSPPPSPSPGS